MLRQLLLLSLTWFLLPNWHLSRFLLSSLPGLMLVTLLNGISWVMSPCPLGNSLQRWKDSFPAFHFSSPTWTSSRFGGIPLGKLFSWGGKNLGVQAHPWSCVGRLLDHEMMSSRWCHMDLKHGSFENEAQAWVNHVPLVSCHMSSFLGTWWSLMAASMASAVSYAPGGCREAIPGISKNH